MKKTHSTNIGGRIFEVEEDAFQQLTAYLASMSARFQAYPDAKDIVADIEARIAEHLALNTGTPRLVTYDDVVRVMDAMGRPDELVDTREMSDGSPQATSDTMRDTTHNTTGSSTPHTESPASTTHATAHAGMSGTIPIENMGAAQKDPALARGIARPRLFRDTDERVVAGVASGIAAYFDVSPTWIRLLFLVSLFLGGTGLLVYLALWICVPRARTLTDRVRMRGESVTLDTIDQGLREESLASPPKRSGIMRTFFRILIAGVVIIALLLTGMCIAIGSTGTWSKSWWYHYTWPNQVDTAYQMRVDTVLSVGPKSTLDLSTISGAINVSTGPESQVKIVARAAGGADIDFAVTGSTIRVHENIRGGSCVSCSATIDVIVPPGTSLVSTTVSGTQTLAITRGDVSAKSVSGDIEVQEARTVTTEAVSGDITVTLLDTAHVTISASSVSGDIETDFSSSATQQQRIGQNLVVPLNGGGAPVKAKTVSGDIVIRRKL